MPNRRTRAALAAALLLLLSLSVDASAAIINGGRAATSAHLSTNPAVRRQQLLCDPVAGGLTIVGARIDVRVNLDTPVGFTAQDFVDSITVTPFAPFTAVGQLPFYDENGGQSGVIFDATSFLIQGIEVEGEFGEVAPGNVFFAQVDIQYDGAIDPELYGLTFSTHSVQPGPDSFIDASDGNQVTRFGPDQIDPSSDSSFLGVPEPTSLALVAAGAVALLGRRRGSAGSLQGK